MTVLIFSFKKKDTVSSAALMFLVIYVGTEMNCCVTLISFCFVDFGVVFWQSVMCIHEWLLETISIQACVAPALCAAWFSFTVALVVLYNKSCYCGFSQFTKFILFGEELFEITLDQCVSH